jgi:DNA replication protein DnaC
MDEHSEPMDPKFREWADRMAARNDDPEYQRHATKLAAEIRDFQDFTAARSLRARLLRSGVPEEHWVAFTTPTECPAITAVRTFLAAPPAARLLVLAGTAGQGKSFALAWAVYSQGGQFVNLHELATASSFDEVFWDRLEAATVLALDELGGEKMHDAFEARLYGLLNARYQRNRKTLIATNLLAADFRARYLANGLERLGDRLRSSAEWVNLAGPSMRRPWSEGRP